MYEIRILVTYIAKYDVLRTSGVTVKNRGIQYLPASEILFCSASFEKAHIQLSQ